MFRSQICFVYLSVNSYISKMPDTVSTTTSAETHFHFYLSTEVLHQKKYTLLKICYTFIRNKTVLQQDRNINRLCIDVLRFENRASAGISLKNLPYITSLTRFKREKSNSVTTVAKVNIIFSNVETQLSRQSAEEERLYQPFVSQ